MKRNAVKKAPPRGRLLPSKIFLIMKLTIVLLVVAALQVSATGYGQRINLSERNAPLVKIFKEIKRQSGYRFFYEDSLITNAKKVDIEMHNASVEDVLDVCLKNQKLSYAIVEKTIAIKRADEKTVVQTLPPPVVLLDVTGYVTDENKKPLAGVSVTLIKDNKGTVTNESGMFSISVPANSVLRFSYVGYEIAEVAVKNQSVINVTLKLQVATLNDLVIVGYGQQKKESVTGAITTMSSKQLVQSPVTNLSNALAGRLSGLTAIQSTGKPGADAASLYVRGVGTYTGNTNPLIMVDGIARDSYNDIDPNEVENISILKDASATAVYGVRGANGVILITTKRGKEGAPRISATAQTAVSQFTRMPDFVNSYEYASLQNELSFENYWINHAKDADIHTWSDFVTKRDQNWVKEAVLYYTPQDLLYYQNANKPKLADGSVNPNYDPYFHPDQEWKSQIFKKYALQSQFNTNITGGTNSLKYFVSLGYLTQGGLFKTDYMPFSNEMDFKKNRYNLRSNFDFDVNKDFRISVDLGSQFVTITGMDNDGYTWEKRILWSTPLGSPGMINGKFVIPFNNQNTQLNPLYSIASSNNYNVTTNSTLNSSVKMSYKLDFITKGLSVNAKGAYDSYFSSRSGGKSYPMLYGIRENPNGDRLNPILVQLSEVTPSERWSNWYNGKWRKMYGEFSLNYNRTFGKHAVTGLILYNAEKKYDPSLTPDLPHAYLGMAGRVTYAFSSKYLAEFNMGYNGSENFPEGKRFGFLPAYSLGWVASKEKFFPKTDYITYLKIRGSLGKVGNDIIGGARYLYLPNTWQYTGGYYFGTLNDRNFVQGAAESVIGNPDVTWETATKANVGFEARLFKDKLTLSFDHFNEHRVNILSYRGTVPAIVQATLPPYNLGEVENWGNELEIGYNGSTRKFSYWVKANISNTKNKIIFKDEPIVPGLEYQAATGKPINQGLYLKSNGLYNSWGDLYEVDGSGNPNLAKPVLALNSLGKPYTNAQGLPVYQKDLGFAGVPLQPGEVRLLDVNEDGVIDEKDYVRTGKTDIPQYTFGVSFGFSFKGFDFSVLMQGVSGVAKNAMQNQLHFNKQESLFEVDLNRYTEERFKQGNTISFPIAAYNHQAANNTYFLLNTSYVRLKNLEVGYTLQPKFLSKIGIRSARVYVNGYNLMTWSPNSIWGDPENLGYIGYPLTRVYNTGLNINF